jgi:ferredoxin
MNLRSIFSKTAQKQERLASQAVVPDPLRCVQCGICSYNCPLGIDVRLHALQGLAVVESKCLTCGECVKRCPRGVLRFDAAPLEQIPLKAAK